MSHRPTRRGFLGLTGKAAAVATGVAAFPVICSGQAFASSAELAVVTRPDHPNARYAESSDGSFQEPLNASVSCGLPRRHA